MDRKPLEDQVVSEAQMLMNQRRERMIIMGRAAALLDLVKLNAARLSDNHSKIIDDFIKLSNDLLHEKFDDPRSIDDLINKIWNSDDMHSTISSEFYNPETPIEFSAFQNQRKYLN